MTAPSHATTTDPVEPTEPADTEPEGQGDDGNREENLRELVGARDEWRKKAEAAHQVLELVGIEVGEDGSFDPNALEEWHEQTRTSRERARRDLLLEAGFSIDTAEGELLSMKIDAGEIDADPTSIEAYALERGWTRNAVLYSGIEKTVLDGATRLDQLNAASMSDTSGEPTTEIEAQIAEARANNDFVTASRLQEKYERKQRRR